MGVRLINHGDTEEAIRAARAYACYLTDLAEGLSRHTGQVGNHWQGLSYHRFLEAIDVIRRQLDQGHDSAAAAERKLGGGLREAINDERMADAEAEQRRQQTGQP